MLPIALVAVVLAVQPDGQWTPLPALPIAVSNNAVTSVDHGDGSWTLYSFMGIRPPARGVDTTALSFRLDWSEAHGAPAGWQPIADAPRLGNRAKVAASAVTVAGEVYLIGGYTTGRTEVTEKRLFRYEPDTDAYTELAPVPTEVDDTVPAVYRGRYIYLISGWHGPITDNTTAVQVYDTQTDQWRQATAIPGPADGLFGHAGGIVERNGVGTLVYMDGTVSEGGFSIASRVFVGAIDPADETVVTWTEIPAHPGAPTYRAAGAFGLTPAGSLLIVGGTDNPYNISGIGYNGVASAPLDQALAFDPASLRWRTLRLPGRSPTMDHRNLARLGDGWAIVGGMTAPQQMTDTCWRLTLDPCIADFTGDLAVDAADMQAWIEAFLAGDPAADQNGDGQVSPADWSAWVMRANRGCL
jgi:hypothetical protein